MNNYIKEFEICVDCGGAGGEEIIVGENIVSMDMAIDACDRSLAGQHHSYVTDYLQCERCSGSGRIESELKALDK